MDFANLFKKTLKFLRAKKKLIKLVWIDKKSDQIEDLIDKCKKNTQIGFATNYFTLLFESPF